MEGRIFWRRSRCRRLPLIPVRSPVSILRLYGLCPRRGGGRSSRAPTLMGRMNGECDRVAGCYEQPLTIAIVVCVERRSDPEGTHNPVPEGGEVTAAPLEEATDDEKLQPVPKRGEREHSRDERVEVICSGWQAIVGRSVRCCARGSVEHGGECLQRHAEEGNKMPVVVAVVRLQIEDQGPGFAAISPSVVRLIIRNASSHRLASGVRLRARWCSSQKR